MRPTPKKEPKRYQDVREVLQTAVKEYPNHTAFILKEKQESKVKYHYITYTMFQEEINCLGAALLSLGLKNKRVAIIGPNRYEWCTSYLAVVNGVGVVVPLDKGLPEEEIESLLQRSKAEAVIFEAKYIPAMKRIKEKANNQVTSYICMNEKEDGFLSYLDLVEKGKELLANGDNSYLKAEIDPEKMSFLLFTSGTTSISKAVMLSHRNIAENIYALNCAETIYDTDVSLAFLPLHHTFGATGFLLFLSNGVAAAFCDGIRYIQQNLKEYKVSIFVCVPLLLENMYKKINAQIEKQGKTKLIRMAKAVSNLLLKLGIDIRRKIFKSILEPLGGNLRFVVSGAATIDKEVAKGFNEFGILTVQGYGLTETSPVLTAEDENRIRYGSVGHPLCNVEVKIDHPNEEGIGEIKTKGPNVMQGYYETEEETKEVLKDGWFYTGDLGYFDKDGYLFITGRKKNVIVLKNGKNIYPEESEVLINNYPYVAESMVFGYPKQDDSILCAKIVYNKEYVSEKYADKSKEELGEMIWKDIKALNAGMPNYKHIKKIIVTDEPMIKTTTQKIKRFEEIKKILEAEQ